MKSIVGCDVPVHAGRGYELLATKDPWVACHVQAREGGSIEFLVVSIVQSTARSSMHGAFAEFSGGVAGEESKASESQTPKWSSSRLRSPIVPGELEDTRADPTAHYF